MTVHHLTKAEREALKQALHLREVLYEAGIGSSRKHRKDTLLGLQLRGFFTCKTAVVCDGDGFSKEPERYRDAYFLTDEGLATAKRLRWETEGEKP
jgi:hypothetical protein